MIKGVVFDLGGVLLDNPASKMKSFISAVLDIPEEVLVTRISPLMADFQKGRTSESEVLSQVSSDYEGNRSAYDSIWRKAIEFAYFPKKEMFSLVLELKQKGLKLGILSNTEMPVVEVLKEKDYSIFDVLVFSCLEGVRKPEKEIYWLLVNRLGLKAEEIIFIDDREENIISASQIGLKSILFKSPQQVKAEISQYSGIRF